MNKKQLQLFKINFQLYKRPKSSKHGGFVFHDGEPFFIYILRFTQPFASRRVS